MREPMRDLLHRAVGWYEPSAELMDGVSARVRRRARRQRAAAAAVPAAVFLLGGVLVFRAFGPSGGTAVGDQDYGTYILSDFRVGPAIDRQTGEEISGRALVEYRVTWSTPEYPGDHRCEVAVFDAGGRRVGSLEFEQGSMLPESPSGIEVDVNGTPASATGSCVLDRLDAPVAYLISDPTVVPANHADADLAVAFTVAWPEGLADGEYPSTNACLIEVFAPDRTVFATYAFTLAAGPGRIEQDVWLAPDKRGAILGQDVSAYSATVRCEPYTAAHVEPPEVGPEHVAHATGFGLALDVPASWDWRAYQRGDGAILQAAPVRLTSLDHDAAAQARNAIGIDEFVIVVADESVAPFGVGLPAASLPVQVQLNDLCSQCMEGTPSDHAVARFVVTVDSRPMVVFVEFGSNPPSDALLNEANTILATLKIEGEA